MKTASVQRLDSVTLVAASGWEWFSEVSPANLNLQAVKRPKIALSIIAHVTRTYIVENDENPDLSYERPIYKIDTDTLRLTEFRGSQGSPNEFGHTVFATVIYNQIGHGCSMGGKVNADGSITWETYAD